MSYEMETRGALSEQTLIGVMLQDNNLLEEMAALRPDDFSDPMCRNVFTVAREMRADGKAVDVVSVYQECIARALDVDIKRLGDMVTDAIQSNVAVHVQVVQDCGMHRRLARVAGELHQLACGHLQAKDMIARAEAAVLSVGGERSHHTATHLRDAIAPVVKDIEERAKRKSPITGVPTGFVDLDHKLAGLHPGEVTVIAGRPSMGKTTLAENIMRHVVMHTGKPGIIFSLEMTTNQLTERAFAAHGNIPLASIRTGQLSDVEWARLAETIGALKNAPIIIDENPAADVAYIRSVSNRVRRKDGLSIVMVDYLQLMSGDGGNNRNDEIATISRQMKLLSKELGVPIILLSQLNRGLEQRTNKRPVMSDLRDSGAVEQDADVILFVYRDEVYNPNSQSKGVAELIVAKQRNGPTGEVNLIFNGNCVRFDNYAGPAIQVPQAPPRRRGNVTVAWGSLDGE